MFNSLSQKENDRYIQLPNAIPIKQFIPDRNYSFSSRYYHYRKWVKDGSWENVWTKVLQNHKYLLDLSSIQIYGSHTIAKKEENKLAIKVVRKIKQVI